MSNPSDTSRIPLRRRWIDLKAALATTLLAEMLAWSLLRGDHWRTLGVGWQFWSLVVAVAALAVLAASSCRWLFRRRVQFNLKSLLTLVLCLGASLGLISRYLQGTVRQRSAAAALERIGANVSYSGAEQPGLLTFVGRRYFQEPIALGYHQGALSENDLNSIGSLTGLRFLSLENTLLSDADLAHFASLGELKTLHLVRTRATGRGLQYLKPHNMGSLDLSWSPIDDVGLEQLQRLKMLSVLNLNHTRITDAGLIHLASLDGLFALYLDGTTITGEGFVHIKGLRHLEEISLERSWLTNAGVAALHELPALTGLNLSNTNIDDEAVGILSGMSRLKTLRLQGTDLDEQGMHQLKKALPGCEILY